MQQQPEETTSFDLDPRAYNEHGEKKLVRRYIDPDFVDLHWFHTQMCVPWVIEHKEEFGAPEHIVMVYMKAMSVIRAKLRDFANDYQEIKEKYRELMMAEIPDTPRALLVQQMNAWGNAGLWNSEYREKVEARKLLEQWKRYEFIVPMAGKIISSILNGNEMFLKYFEFFIELFLYIFRLYDQITEPQESNWVQLQQVAIAYSYFVNYMYAYTNLDGYTITELSHMAVGTGLDPLEHKKARKLTHSKLRTKILALHGMLKGARAYPVRMREYIETNAIHPAYARYSRWLDKNQLVEKITWKYSPKRQLGTILAEHDPRLAQDLSDVNMLGFFQHTIEQNEESFINSLIVLGIFICTMELILGVTDFQTDYVIWSLFTREIDDVNSVCNYPKIVCLCMNEWAVVSQRSILRGSIYDVITEYLKILTDEMDGRFPIDSSERTTVEATLLTDYAREIPRAGRTGRIESAPVQVSSKRPPVVLTRPVVLQAPVKRSLQL